MEFGIGPPSLRSRAMVIVPQVVFITIAYCLPLASTLPGFLKLGFLLPAAAGLVVEQVALLAAWAGETAIAAATIAASRKGSRSRIAGACHAIWRGPISRLCA